MAGDLVTIEARGAGALASLVTVQERAQDYARLARAANTKRAYASDWRHFESWCGHHGLDALPAAPATLTLYLTAMADAFTVATLQRRRSSIAVAHRMAGHPNPCDHAAVQAVWEGIRRAKGTAPRKKAPAVTDTIRDMLAGLGDRTIDMRDRALILVGFAGALRRSEIVALDVADVTFTGEGLRIVLRRSKTDQEGEGQAIGLPYGSNPATCPVRALQAWLAVIGNEAGPLFRAVNRHGAISVARLSDKAVALIVKRLALAIGKDPAAFAGHSLRSGFCTSSIKGGASERAMMRQSRHKSVAVARGYIHEAELFSDNAATRLGL